MAKQNLAPNFECQPDLTMNSYSRRCTHPPPSQQRRHPFRRAPANSMRLFVSRGFAVSMAETTIVTRD